ncbi:uncharacterized protein LOC109888057 [Oncorhynchus kisutch]|uniref:uncharacterized protein LOC109888057 n=1 Tax=Oncorhynchus kisutch TaxID=8019 RepID=UPI0012DE77AC|nr:uncharacterized protein LOC109888057 [Oncorhynchus kisutch]
MRSMFSHPAVLFLWIQSSSGWMHPKCQIYDSSEDLGHFPTWICSQIPHRAERYTAACQDVTAIEEDLLGLPPNINTLCIFMTHGENRSMSLGFFSQFQDLEYLYIKGCFTQILPSGNSHLPSGNSHLPSGNSHLPSGNSHLPSWNSHLPSGNSQLPSGNSQLPSGNSHLPSWNSHLPSGNSHLPSGNSHLPSGNSHLPNLQHMYLSNWGMDSDCCECHIGPHTFRDLVNLSNLTLQQCPRMFSMAFLSYKVSSLGNPI